MPRAGINLVTRAGFDLGRRCPVDCSAPPCLPLNPPPFAFKIPTIAKTLQLRKIRLALLHERAESLLGGRLAQKA
jgi:hypothetical protein